MVESSFVLLCKPLDFARHNMHLQVINKVVSLLLYHIYNTVVWVSKSIHKFSS
jgi:hypothetical protein